MTHRCPTCRTLLPSAPDPMASEEMLTQAYWGVQKVLDEALGTEEDDGAGAGIVADVYLLMRQRNVAITAVAALTQEVAALRAQKASDGPEH